jgi:murein DD-endopeptidase MepM/ murein hydrolase activator NlpD
VQETHRSNAHNERLVNGRLLSGVGAGLGALIALLGPVTGSSAPYSNVATSQAFGVRVLVPDEPPVTAGYVAAPSDSTGATGGFAYPDDGSALTSGVITLSATAGTLPLSAATASVEVTDVSLFGGEVTIQRVDAKVDATADETGGEGDFTGTGVTGLGGSAVVGNQLGDWGTITLSPGTGEATTGETSRGWHGSVGAVDIELTADHGGLPAGTEIVIGYAAVNVLAVVAPAATTTTTTPATTDVGPIPFRVSPGRQAARGPGQKTAAQPKRGQLPRVPIGKVPTLHPKLTAGRYVFPVFGDVSYGDTFGAPRADVGWHHGDDIFAPLGAPVLAVADGTVFSVGWNTIGGWRLWLRDRQGNEFYYAHLSAYSPYARNKAFVRAGTVLGFVGNTGDARGTPYHLHFEVHPVALLPLGYDGAVDPTRYLDAWRRLQDVRFGTVGAWLPGLARLTPSRAPEPGAILLQFDDISSASGLDPGSLRRALAPMTRVSLDALGGLLDRSAGRGVTDLGRG